MTEARLLQVAPRLQAGVAVAPQVVAQSTLLEMDFLALDKRIEQEVADNPALDLEEDKPPLKPLLVPAPAVFSAEDKPPNLEDVLRAPYTLQDDLWWQFRASTPQTLHPLGERLVAAVDDRGYLRADVFEVARELQVPVSQAQQAIQHLQQLEPVGVGARSLQECLLLQLARQQAEGKSIPPGTEEVIKACGGYPGADLVGQLARKAGCRRARVAEILNYIRHNLYPYPGAGFVAAEGGAEEIRGCRYPDVIIRQQGQKLTIEIPMSRVHYLRLNWAYLALERAQQGVKEQQEEARQQEARQQLERAREFLHMLERREHIIKQIAEAVVEYQRQFLLLGSQHHRPLTKKSIAQLTGLHESTVCRATRGKYVMMPNSEIVDFAVFFEAAVPVKRLIAHLVQQEPKRRPLSDERIARLLAEQGHEVARRTVAKYRRTLEIPSSVHRKQRVA